MKFMLMMNALRGTGLSRRQLAAELAGPGYTSHAAGRRTT